MEREHLGVPLKPQVLIKGLRQVNLFMPRRLVEAWLQHCMKAFEEESGLTHWEFLFLVCNAQDRSEMIDRKLPHGKFRLDKDKYMATYVFDAGLEHSRAPDSWLQKVTNSGIDEQKIMFEFESNSKPPSPIRRKPPRRMTVHIKEATGLSMYRQLLRDPGLFNEIKERVNESNSFVTLSRQVKVTRKPKSKLTTPALHRLSISRPRSKAELKRLHTSVGPDCGHRFSRTRPASAGIPHSLRSSGHSFVWDAAIAFAAKQEASRVTIRPFSAKTNTTTKSSKQRSSRPFITNSITSMSGVSLT
jgi:hypothetical protein